MIIQLVQLMCITHFTGEHLLSYTLNVVHSNNRVM